MDEKYAHRRTGLSYVEKFPFISCI